MKAQRDPSSVSCAATFSRKGRRATGGDAPWPARCPTLLALTLAACAAPAEPEPTYLALDCAKPFEAQVAAIVAQPHLDAAGVVGSEPYAYYSAPDGRTSYLVTRRGSPAHPAIMMQKAKGSDVVTSGCPYGSRKGYDQLKAYLDSLKTWTRKT